MREDNDNEAYKGQGIRGWGWGLFGVACAAGAKYVFGGPGGLGGLFGGPIGGPGAPVSRETTDLIVENAVLKAQLPQVAINTKQSAEIDCLRERITRMESLTQVVVPNGNVAPGWGPAFVTPGVPTPPALSDATITAIANQVAAQMKAAA